MAVHSCGRELTVAHNGNIINAGQLRAELERQGVCFVSDTDSEVIAALIASYYEYDLISAVKRAMRRIRGAYSLLIMCADSVVAVRDPHGFRPLVLGKLNEGYVVASESCALDSIGAKHLRDIEPGEIVLFGKNGLFFDRSKIASRKALCMFEYIYFARPDTIIDGVSVYKARVRAGEILADEHPVCADVVIGVPDSGVQAGYGYAMRAGIPYSPGFVKNRYIARTFIKPDQHSRELSVSLKLNPIAEIVRGKRVVMVDDSIVRGTTSKKTISLLRAAGASEVHVRVASPLVVCPCYFGIDTPRKNELIAANEVLRKIQDKLQADSLGYLSVEGLCAAVGGNGHCLACFNGDYPVKLPRALT